MTSSRCVVKDCSNEGVFEVSIRLPKHIGPFDIIAEDERVQPVRVCADHVSVLGMAISHPHFPDTP